VRRRAAGRRPADIAAVGAILLAGGLSAFWAFFIPIFQSPDEPAHFDYAASIYGAGRLIERADGSPTWIASPYAAYLLRASDFNRIAGHSPMRATPGYGSRAYFAALDAAAPSVRVARPPQGRVSYIVGLYPFAFYALEALWMHAIALFTSSLASLFFAARLFCTALLMLGLYFNYRTALRLGVPPAASSALIAAIGIFPMTSLVSSYVQPDNLAYALVSAALFYATKLRDGSLTPLRIVPLGIALGLLAVTKYHFFLSATLPIAALIAVTLTRSKCSATRAVVTFAVLLAPAIALLSVQHWIVDAGTSVAHTAPKDISLAYVRGVAVRGPAALVGYLASSVSGAFLGCFITGICAAGYWGVVGWGDTPIVIGTPLLEELLRGVIALITLIVAAIVLFYCARNAIWLVAAAARNHARAAARIAVADPVINSYLMFAAIIVALYVATNNVFGVSGRHWYPYIFPAFLCLVWYAPRSLLGCRQRVGTVAACVLFAYSAVAAAYALAGAQQRYYGMQIAAYVTTDAPRSVAGTALGVQWPPADGTYVFAPSPGKFSYDRGTPVAFTGTAMGPDGSGAQDVAALLDGRHPVAVLTRQYLFGIAEATHSIAAGYSGFGGYIATERLAEGPHTVTAFARTGVGGSYQSVNPSRVFFVTASQGRLSPAFLITLPRSGAIGSLSAATTCRGTVSTGAGGVTTIAGSILLLRGRVSLLARAGNGVAFWLRAGDLPYPAKYDPAKGTFLATLPTSTLAPGAYDVAFYARDASLHNALVATLPVRVLASTALAPFVANAPAECADPLKELAQTFS
jgi:hypothetical protein